jgi:hypothetical protein
MTPPRRFMVFVDGSNVLNRLKHRMHVRLDPHGPPDEAITLVRRLIERELEPHGVVQRCYWFGSHHPRGDKAVVKLRERLWSHGFHPVLFRKCGRHEKRVDVALAVTMLSHAASNALDVAVLVSADADYVPLIKEVKRHAAVWALALPGSEFPADLKHELDSVRALDDYLSPGGRGDAADVRRAREALVRVAGRAADDDGSIPDPEPEPQLAPASPHARRRAKARPPEQE